eukprot:8923974-Heterocapsa_arctica.AAC.1
MRPRGSGEGGAESYCAGVRSASWVWQAAMMLMPRWLARVTQSSKGTPDSPLWNGPLGRGHSSEPSVMSAMSSGVERWVDRLPFLRCRVLVSEACASFALIPVVARVARRRWRQQGRHPPL